MHTIKVTSIIIILISLIIVLGIFIINFLESSSSKIENQLTVIESDVKSGKWDKADAVLTAAKKEWKGTSKIWSALIDHFEIDNIDVSFSKIEKYIAAKDASMTLAEAAALNQFIKHIPDKETFNLKNIF